MLGDVFNALRVVMYVTCLLFVLQWNLDVYRGARTIEIHLIGLASRHLGLGLKLSLFNPAILLSQFFSIFLLLDGFISLNEGFNGIHLASTSR